MTTLERREAAMNAAEDLIFDKAALGLRPGTDELVDAVLAGLSSLAGDSPEKYAEQLAIAIRERCYPEVPQFEPMTGDVMGLLSQIDNMTTGMVRNSSLSQPAAVGVTDEMVERVSVPYDGFTGDVIGSYTTREGKQGVVVQQDGTRVVHVYGRSRVEAARRSTP